MPSDFDLLRPLDTEPRLPSTVDIDLAISTARRKRVVRGATYAGAATLTAAAIVGGVIISSSGPSANPTLPAATRTPTSTAKAANAPVSCTVEKLAVPNGKPSALISGSDPAGKYFVGRSYPDGGGYQAVVWHSGVGTEVQLPGDSEESLEDVNSSGTAVGWSYLSAGAFPFVYRNGKVTQLPSAQPAQASAINDAGAIAGDDGVHALLWPTASTSPTRLSVPSGTGTAKAVDIDEDGTVVGTLDNKVPYVWLPDGTHHALRLPDTDGKQFEGRAFHIRDGWVIGVANEAGAKAASGAKKAQGQIEAIRWNLRTGEMQVVAQIDKSADAVNALGWQTGVAAQGGAQLLAGDKLVKLPGLAPIKEDSLADIANTISDDGRTIGGQSNDASGTIQPVVWHCK